MTDNGNGQDGVFKDREILERARPFYSEPVSAVLRFFVPRFNPLEAELWKLVADLAKALEAYYGVIVEPTPEEISAVAGAIQQTGDSESAAVNALRAARRCVLIRRESGA